MKLSQRRTIPIRDLASALGLAAALTSTPASAGWLERAVDVPTDLGPATWMPNEIVGSSGGIPSLAAALPDGFEVGAFERRPGGKWWIVPSEPTDALCGAPFGPLDIVEWDGASCSLPWSTLIPPLPVGARIDALVAVANRPVVSFDVPVTLGATTFAPSDLVMVVGTPAPFFTGADAGVPAGSNLVGASTAADGELVVTFDVPTTIAATTHLPGQLLRWNGSAFATELLDPAWPPGSVLRDFSLGPSAGHVPDGHLRPGTPLTLAESGAGLALDWGIRCSSSDVVDALYSGALGSWSSQVPLACSVAGQSYAIEPPSGDRWFVVVPNNAVAEGSHGLVSDGSERPRGAAFCLPQDLAASCP